METGIELIAKERNEQINKHGFDEANDDYQNGELVEAALFAIAPNGEFEKRWPDGWYEHFEEKIKNKDRIGQLKVAGAFLAAEIDRLQCL
ncbi:hypothetical protein GCM10028807_32890 [Spirosoma daeguense]